MKRRLPARKTKARKGHTRSEAALANLGAVGCNSRSRGGLWKGTWSGPIAAIPMEGSQDSHL